MKVYKVDGQMPNDGKISHCLLPGELKSTKWLSLIKHKKKTISKHTYMYFFYISVQ